MCKTIDLHTHSYCSDGTFSPEGLVILAKKQGLSAIALTDHDTIDGLELFLEAGEKHGMETTARKSTLLVLALTAMTLCCWKS